MHQGSLVAPSQKCFIGMSLRRFRSIAALGAASLCSIGLAAGGQQPWQQLQRVDVRHVSGTWKDPAPEYGPEPYYGLGGAVTLEVVGRDLDTLHQLGFRAVTVQAGRNLPFDYLSPEYFAFFKSFVQEAKKRGMRVWIVDDAGYPSGFAGGRFTSTAPELRMQALVVAQRIPVSAGGSVHQHLKPETISATAVNSDGSTVSLPVVDGNLDWTAPTGEWTVLIVEHGFRTSPTRSDTNKQNVKDTSQSLEDYLNPAATRKYLEFTHEQYKKYVGDEFGKTIMGFRGDEPDYSISGLPWTPGFLERFQQIKGYDVRPIVGAFAQMSSARDAGVAVKLTPLQLRAKADYYDVFSQIFAGSFFKVQGDWCATNHLEYQVHLNHEEMEMQLVRSEGEFFRDMRYVQVPGIDTIWHQIWRDTISDFPRLASSVSHVYGRPRAFTESFAAYRPAPDIETARYILNEQFVRGINLIETMYFPSTAAGPRPAPSYMGQPGFAELLTYVRRMSYLMSMGHPTASVALYLPSSSMWMGDATADAQFVAAEQMLSEHQIDFDVVNLDALARDLKAGKGSLETLSGNQYRTVILPAIHVLSKEELDRLKSFAGGGGKVLFLGGTPKLIYERAIRDASEVTAADFAWATIASGALLETPTPPAQPPAAPPQPQVIPAGMLKAVSAAVATPIRLDVPDTAIRVMRRRLQDADVYLFFNEGPNSSQHSVQLMSKGKAELWDAQTGEISALTAKPSNGGLTFPLKLKPYEAQVIVVREKP